jgi:hypothetical protein
MSIDTLNILNGLSHVIGEFSYDGAHRDGEPVEIGLRREEGNPIIDSRVIDGFNIKVYGNKLCLSYNVDGIPIKEVHSNSFESDIDQTMSEVESFLKKEFRKKTGQTLGLKQFGELEIDVENISRVRTLVKAKKHFEVTSLDIEGCQEESDPNRLDKSIRDFLSLKNDQRAKNDNSKENPFKPFDPNKMIIGQRN